MRLVDKLKMRLGAFPEPQDDAHPEVRRAYELLLELQRPQGLPEDEQELEGVVRTNILEEYPESLWEILQDARSLYRSMLELDGPGVNPDDLTELCSCIEELMSTYRSYWSGQAGLPPYLRRYGDNAKVTAVLRWQLRTSATVTGHLSDPAELAQAWNAQCHDLGEVPLESLGEHTALQGVRLVLASGPRLWGLSALERQEEGEQFGGAAEVVRILEVQLQDEIRPEQQQELLQLLIGQLMPPAGGQLAVQDVAQVVVADGVQADPA